MSVGKGMRQQNLMFDVQAASSLGADNESISQLYLNLKEKCILSLSLSLLFPSDRSNSKLFYRHSYISRLGSYTWLISPDIVGRKR